MDPIESIKLQESVRNEQSDEKEEMVSVKQRSPQREESSSDDKEEGSERVSVPDAKEKPEEKCRKFSEDSQSNKSSVKSKAVKKEQVVEDSDIES